MKWDQAQEGQSTGICNGWRADATDLTSNASDFHFKRSKEDIADDVVTATFKRDPDRPGAAKHPGTLNSGECGTVTVSVTGAVDSQTYTGVLTVTSAGGAGIARKSVIITGPPKAKPKVAKAEGAVDTAAFDARRDHPFPSGAALEGGQLPLKAPSHGVPFKLSDTCPKRRDLERLEQRERTVRNVAPYGGRSLEALEAAEKARRAEQDRRRKSCPFVGNVFNGTHVAAIYVDGPRTKPADGLTFLPIRLDRATKIGDYEGALDLENTPSDPKDDIKVKVTVTEAWWWAVAALLLGAVLSLASQWYLRRALPRGQLRQRYRAFGTDYAAAKGCFDKHVTPDPSDGPAEDPDLTGFQIPAGSEIDKYAHDIEDGLTQYSRSVLWFDDKSEAYKQLDASLDQVDEDIRCWKDETGLASSLTDLKAALADLVQFVDDDFPLPEPRLAGHAAALLKGRQLKVGEAKELAADADATTKLVKRWTTMARELKRLNAWWRQLNKTVPRSDWEDVERLDLAGLTVAEATHELLDVREAADFKELRSVRSMQSAYDLLAGLGAKYGWMSPVDPELPAVDDEVKTRLAEHHPMASMLLMFVRPPRDRADAVAKLVAAATPGEGTPALPALLSPALRPVAAALVIALSVATGVAAGLVAFYFGKSSWGTVEDYITVIVVGASAQLLVQGVADTVGKLLPPVPDQLISGPAAAKVAPAAAEA
jgi:hypothetical protein